MNVLIGALEGIVLTMTAIMLGILLAQFIDWVERRLRRRRDS